VQQLTFVKPGVLEWHEVAEPAIQVPDDALVRPVAVTTCDIDGPTIRGMTPLAMMGPYPFGHEFVAEIVDFGDQVTGFYRGQLVAVSFQICCGECDRCRAGLSGSCRVVPPRSMFGFPIPMGGSWGGALSDLVRVPFARNMLVPVPRGVSPHAIASASDNLPDAWRTVAPYLRESPGAEVLIVSGMGNSIALYAVAIARVLGASRVDYLDADTKRLELAKSLGASPIAGPPPPRAGEYQITVDASADPAGLACALRSLAPGGVCTSIGIYYTETTPIPLLEMYGRGVRFHTGRANARPDMPRVLELVQSGRLHPELVTSEVVAWKDAAAALADPSMKPLIVRDATATAS
jgi:threonine dehydrogenase-like Zn-dependent dehydrogenase